MKKLQVADGEAVEPDISIFFNPRKRSDMADLFMLCNIEIVKNCTGCNYAKLQVLHPKSLQRNGLEMAQQPVAGCIFGINPVVEFEREKFRPKIFSKKLVFSFLLLYLFGLKTVQQLVDIFE